MSEHYESEVDFLVGDDYETRYQANLVDAKIEFYNKIEPIKQKFEHLLNEDAICDTPYSTYKLFVKSVEKMKEMAYFDYFDEEGELIEYDFIHTLRELLMDEYGWDIKND
ncbi:MAG: hypothetical protein NZ824_10860 [Candidatus Thioglobus sp.]|nr:hypothetical protein [Candidatus Thioglobus sp.]